MLSVDVSNGLHEELEALALKNKARAIGVALHDLETGFRFSLRGDRWFLQRSRRLGLSRQPGSRRDTGAVRGYWTDREDIHASARNDLREQ
jgi:hypothetical protein